MVAEIKLRNQVEQHTFYSIYISKEQKIEQEKSYKLVYKILGVALMHILLDKILVI